MHSLPPGLTQNSIYQLARWIYRPFSILEYAHSRYGDFFTMHLLGMSDTLVIVADPEAIRTVFSAGPDEMHAGEVNRVLAPFLGMHSLIMLDGKEHLRQRKLMMPAFHGERMQAYGQTMIDFAHEAINAWPVGTSFPIHPSMRNITLRVILRTVFGLDEHDSFDELCALLSKTLDLVISPLLLMPIMQKEFGGLSPWGKFKKMSAQIEKQLHAIITKRRQEGTRNRTDILSMLIEARDEHGNAMTDVELQDQLITLLVAGHETTATALAWTFRWILERHGCVEQLIRELQSIDAHNELIPERIARLEFLDAVIREALRLQPVIPLVGRRLKREFQLGSYALPEGTIVAPSIYLAHQRASVFPNPKAFEPERFLQHKPAANEWFPFGGGIRRCIGMAFALYEMKMVLATVLMRTSLRLIPNAKTNIVRRSVTLAPADGLPVVVTKKQLN